MIIGNIHDNVHMIVLSKRSRTSCFFRTLKKNGGTRFKCWQCKPTGRATLAILDVLENFNQIVQRNPHISAPCLSQQICRSELTSNLFPSLSKIDILHFF
jgi:hypothetical protein